MRNNEKEGGVFFRVRVCLSTVCVLLLHAPVHTHSKKCRFYGLLIIIKFLAFLKGLINVWQFWSAA